MTKSYIDYFKTASENRTLLELSDLSTKKSAAVLFSGTGGTVSIIASRNISSITRYALGEYGFNFSAGTFSSANYTAHGMVSAQSGVGIIGNCTYFGSGSNKTASVCDIFTFLGSSNYDPPLAGFIFIEV